MTLSCELFRQPPMLIIKYYLCPRLKVLHGGLSLLHESSAVRTFKSEQIHCKSEKKLTVPSEH